MLTYYSRFCRYALPEFRSKNFRAKSDRVTAEKENRPNEKFPKVTCAKIRQCGLSKMNYSTEFRHEYVGLTVLKGRASSQD